MTKCSTPPCRMAQVLGLMGMAVLLTGCGTSHQVAGRDEADPFLAAAQFAPGTVPASTNVDPFAAAGAPQVASVPTAMDAAPGTARLSDRLPAAPTFAWAAAPSVEPAATFAAAPPSPAAPSHVEMAAHWAEESNAGLETGVAHAGFQCEIEAPATASPAGWQPTRRQQTVAKPLPVAP